MSIGSGASLRVPTVMTHEEARNMIAAMSGVHQLMAKIMYGCGLRVIECLRLRVKDVDFGLNQIIVRGRKREKESNRGGRAVVSPLDSIR